MLAFVTLAIKDLDATAAANPFNYIFQQALGSTNGEVSQRLRGRTSTPRLWSIAVSDPLESVARFGAQRFILAFRRLDEQRNSRFCGGADSAEDLKCTHLFIARHPIIGEPFNQNLDQFRAARIDLLDGFGRVDRIGTRLCGRSFAKLLPE